MDRELQTALASLGDSYQDGIDRLTAAQKAFQVELGSRVDQIETRLNRPGFAIGAGGGKDQRAPEMADWEVFIRRGPGALDRQNSLVIGDDTAGGFLAPDGFVADLARNITLFSPIRSLARVSSMSVPSLKLPRRTGKMTGSWVGETEDRPETAPTYGQDDYSAKEMACFVDISNSLLEDSAFDLSAELAIDFAEEFGRLEGKAFVNGTSGKEPEGFMQNADVPVKNSGAAAAVTADGLIDLYHALPWPYRNNAVWGMNAKTLGSVRKHKSGDGLYLLALAGHHNAPATTILGRPVVEMPDLDDEGANKFPVIFADFMQLYRIFDRLQLSVLRDPLTQATKGQLRLHARRRVAGGVRKAEAGVRLKCAV